MDSHEVEFAADMARFVGVVTFVVVLVFAVLELVVVLYDIHPVLAYLFSLGFAASIAVGSHIMYKLVECDTNV